MTTLDLSLIQAIDERNAANQKTLLTMGTVAAYDVNTPTDVMVTFDSSAVAVPCKVFDVYVAEGDRVGLAKMGRWWTIVGSFTKRWRQVLGGTQWTHGGALVTGLNITELVITSCAPMFLPANTHIYLDIGMTLLVDTTGSTWVFNVRDGTVIGGTVRASQSWTAQSNLFGYNLYFNGQFDTGSTPVVQAFCISASRVGGAGNLSMFASAAACHITATAVCPAGVVEMRNTP